jgi:hypothetical protein
MGRINKMIDKLIELIKESRGFIKNIIVILVLGRLLFLESNHLLLIIECLSAVTALTLRDGE